VRCPRRRAVRSPQRRHRARRLGGRSGPVRCSGGGCGEERGHERSRRRSRASERVVLEATSRTRPVGARPVGARLRELHQEEVALRPLEGSRRDDASERGEAECDGKPAGAWRRVGGLGDGKRAVEEVKQRADDEGCLAHHPQQRGAEPKADDDD